MTLVKRYMTGMASEMSPWRWRGTGGWEPESNGGGKSTGGRRWDTQGGGSQEK